MTSQPVSSVFLCSPLPSGTWWTQGLSIPWCCLPTSFSLCLVFFPLSWCLARWFWPDLMNGRHVHTTSVCVSLWWSEGLLVVRLPAGSWHKVPHNHGYKSWGPPSWDSTAVKGSPKPVVGQSWALHVFLTYRNSFLLLLKPSQFALVIFFWILWQPGVGQNTALHALPAARKPAFLHPAFLFSQFSSVPWPVGSLGGHAGWLSRDPRQSFLQEAILSSSGIFRDVRSLMLSIQRFLCQPWCCPHSEVPWRMGFERLSWCVTCPNHASSHLLTVARRGSFGPTRKLILLHMQLLDVEKFPQAIGFENLDLFSALLYHPVFVVVVVDSFTA